MARGAARLAAGAALALGCASAPPPEDPADVPPDPAPPVEKETWAPSPEEPPPPEPAPAESSGGELLPDEHDISVADCRLLAAQYGAVTRSDQRAALKPGLTEAQRNQAIAAIDGVASKMEEKWSATCEENLVGKVMSPEALKCAVKATTVAAFDACLNAPKE